MASSGISLPGQSVHSAQTAAPGSREGAQTPAHARPPQGGERAGGRGKCGNRWIIGLSSAAARSEPSEPPCRPLERAASRSRGHQRGEYQQLPVLGNLCKKSLAAKTDCLHLFLKEPSSGPMKIFAKGPLECRV